MTEDEEANFRRNSLLNCDVEMGAPTDPKEQLAYYGEERLTAFIQEDWPRYNLAGVRIINLLEDRELL